MSAATPGPSRWTSATLALAAGAVAAVIGLLVVGATVASAVSDPGAVVRWGVPLTTFAGELAASATVGFLLVGTFLVPERARTARRATATRYAALCAWVWAALATATLVLTFADLAGTPLTSSVFRAQFAAFALTLDVTRVLTISAGLALVVALGASVARTRAATSWLLAIALTGVVVLALTGHAAGSASHEDAVNALGVHLLAMVCWVGGLIALMVLRPGLGVDLGATVRRFSTLALWCFGAIALSGIQQAWIRIGSLSGLATAYGALIIAKVVALLVLGVLGQQQRRNLATRLDADPADGRAFARLALTEAAVMGIATGIAVALGRGLPPVPDSLPNPSQVLALTGFPDPGPMGGADWITAWRVNWLFLAVAVLLVALYVAGVRTLHRRGDHWPALRTASWTVGWLLFVYATCGMPGIWGRVLFSTHMVMHMIVAMIVPLLLVPGAPVTLALRALPKRKDKTWGPRELILQVVHSRALRVLGNPLVAAGLFFLSLATFYYSPMFELALRTHTGHLLMVGHFLLTGYLFAWVLVGVDPGPPKWSPLFRLVILFATVSFHAFFGVIITGDRTLLAPDFFNGLQLSWMTNPLADQVTAGQIAWGVGEAPTLVLALMVMREWIRSDGFEAARGDRQAERDGGAELAAYNAYLAERRSYYEESDQ